MAEERSRDWRRDGVHVVRGDELDPDTPQTEGMSRAAAMGDFIHVPPYVPHQEINADPDAALSCVLVRSGQDPVVVNLDLPSVEPEHVRWVDDIHR